MKERVKGGVKERKVSLGLSEIGIERAKQISEISLDPNTKVGCVIMRPDGKIIGHGINKHPHNFSGDYTWERSGPFLETKYPHVVHAEISALLAATDSVEGGTMFVTLFPCNDCAKAIAEAKINEVVYIDDKYKDTDSVKAAKKIFEACGIITTQYVGS